MSVQALSENSFQVLFWRPIGLLNEKIATTAIGANKYNNAAMPYAATR